VVKGMGGSVGYKPTGEDKAARKPAGDDDED
jgi:hypothetical protein